MGEDKSLIDCTTCGQTHENDPDYHYDDDACCHTGTGTDEQEETA